MIEKHTRVNITLPKSLEEELSLVSKELNDKKSHIIARALDLYFDELDVLIADKRYKRYSEGKTDTFSIEEVEKELRI